MEFSNFPNLIVAGTALGVGCKWVKYWLTKKSLAQEYVTVANKMLIESDSHPDVLDVSEALEDIFIEQTEKPKRAVRKHGYFRSYLIQVGKAKFGTPMDTRANRLVVRKFLYDESVSHGVIARHISLSLDFAVEAVFVPSKAELLAKAVHRTSLATIRHEVERQLGSSTPLD